MRPSFLAALLLLAGSAHAGEPAFNEGDVLGYADVGKLEPFLPPDFWAHRELFFYEGMQLEIGPTQRDYSPAAAYVAATKEFAGRAKLGLDGSLEGYVAGQPFPMDKIDCAGDSDAGTKIAWNFDYRWEGAGSNGEFRITYWDRGEPLPLEIEGTAQTVAFQHRVEPEYVPTGRSLFRRERHKLATVVVVSEPPAARGRGLKILRYLSSDGPIAGGRRDDAWIYSPERRRMIRLGEDHATDAVAGTDLSLESFRGFSGIVTSYRWECRGRRSLIAPMNTRAAGFPYDERRSVGPSGGSFADDRWEVRRAIEVRLVPKDDTHPMRRQDLFLDEETLEPLYGFAYGSDDALWRIVWHDHRWSGDSLPQDGGPWYAGWAGIEEPRDLRTIADVIANVQTGSVTRVEYWKTHGAPLSRARVRRLLDWGYLPE